MNTAPETIRTLAENCPHTHETIGIAAWTKMTIQTVQRLTGFYRDTANSCASRVGSAWFH
jgi:hypothetical protein